MICSRCSLGAAMLVEARRWAHPNLVVSVADKTTACITVAVEDLLGQLARVMHNECEFSNCACQHRTNVVEGIDWQKVVNQPVVKLPYAYRKESNNGSGNNDEGSASQI